jgi:cellulose synthase/poly-beta-1,6-N-acetylglucosamine synthase-like glycosyltransferase
MTETQGRRPLVTFAVFAYNQAKYIRQAVEGAFDQNYEPLEIILSDDASSDETFEIMCEMAAVYSGPHAVRVRKNEKNLGVLGHILTVAREAEGEFIVVAAGDDISFPQRVQELVPFFDSEQVGAVWSQDVLINDRGELIDIDELRLEKRRRWHRFSACWILGATAAYRTSFLKILSLPSEPIFMEDVVFEALLSFFNGKSKFTETSLIKYRYHDNNISIKDKKAGKSLELDVRYLERWARACQSKEYALAEGVRLTFSLGPPNKHSFKRVALEKEYFRLLSEWGNGGPLQRLYFLYLSWRMGKTKSGFRKLLA